MYEFLISYKRDTFSMSKNYFSTAHRLQVFSIFYRALKHQKTVALFKVCVTSCAFVLVSRIRAELIRTYHGGEQKTFQILDGLAPSSIANVRTIYVTSKLLLTFINFY